MAKKIKMSQHDESSAGAVIPSKEDLQREMNAKVDLKIKAQSNLRKQYLTCMYMNVELGELREIHNNYGQKDYGKFELFDGTIIRGEWKFEKNAKGELMYGYIETQEGKKHMAKDVKITHKLHTQDFDESRIPKTGYGLPYSKEMLRWEYEIKESAFADQIASLNFQVAEIMKLGFSKEHIESIKYKGKYIKEPKLLDNMEETWLKENNPNWGKEVD